MLSLKTCLTTFEKLVKKESAILFNSKTNIFIIFNASFSWKEMLWYVIKIIQQTLRITIVN